jgi:16S rRNA (guanine527-N7)-methyltransferase
VRPRSADRRSDPFAGFELEAAILARAAASGIELPAGAVAVLAQHARQVLRANPELKLTAITGPAEFVERHIGESLEGAALLADGVVGSLVDLGSGNGYPGLPVAALHPGLSPLLVEASSRKVEFLRALLESLPSRGEVLEHQIQRASDLVGRPPIRVLVTRAMGNWERVLPRLRPCLAVGADLLLWAGRDVERIAARKSWQRLRLVERRALPGREHSWIWHFRPEL